MLDYQNQNCNLTLQEGLECYYNSFPKTKEIFKEAFDNFYINREDMISKVARQELIVDKVKKVWKH